MTKDEVDPMLVRIAVASVLVLATALLVSPWAGHIDDTDAQLYQTLARGMAQDHRWLDAGPPPFSTRPFREHLPFGLWPYVATVRLAGEGALGVTGALFSLLTVALITAVGIRLLGFEGGIAAGVILAATETFFLYGGRPRLDPPLMFFATAAAAQVLLGRGWGPATALAAVAALVKGPFGLLPLVCAVAARAIVERSPRVLFAGAVATLVAAVPAAAFVLPDQSWREGYLRAQVLASATGVRTEGSVELSAAVLSIARRFWPGLPLVLAGAFAARRDRNARLLALWCAFLLVGLTLPTRKVWNHTLVAYPALALVAGAGAARWLTLRRVAISAAALAALAVAASAAGLGKRLLLPPCIASREFAPELDRVPAGTPVLVVASPMDWRTLNGLAAERRLSPWPMPSLSAPPPSPAAAQAEVALIEDGNAVVAPWREIAHARGWTLLRR